MTPTTRQAKPVIGALISQYHCDEETARLAVNAMAYGQLQFPPYETAVYQAADYLTEVSDEFTRDASGAPVRVTR